MTNLEFHDIYALDYRLIGYRVPPPGIDQLKSLDYPGKPIEFEIRDANYYPRFADSATKIDELSQLAGIGRIDLVVGINQKLLEDIIELVEPIKVSGIPIEINHYNFTTILSLLVEGKKKINNSQTSKSIVSIIAETLLARLQRAHLEKKALSIVMKHFIAGEILLGSADHDIQKALDSLRLFDTWQYDRGDWVYPVFTSISRNKSDRLMNRDFTVEHLGSCERLMTLTQIHGFDFTEESRLRSLAHTLGLDDKIPLLLPIQ